MPITKIVFIRAKKGHEEALGGILLNLVQAARLERGCLDYDLHRAVDDPALWFLYQSWDTENGFQAHLKKPAARACIRDAQPMVEADMNLQPFKMISQPVRRHFHDEDALAA
ncbi:putative quinol monooxygenase [Undibacterium sp.]|uniref:putative quinol monooxygenase n=1 Tax=Undibacterium sp. TaxID=1914977 RepID=UPI00374CAB0D